MKITEMHPLANGGTVTWGIAGAKGTGATSSWRVVRNAYRETLVPSLTAGPIG